MDSCKISIDLKANKALQGLKDYCGSNNNLFYSYLTDIIKNVDEDGLLEFTPAFKETWNYKEELNAKTSNPIRLKDAIVKYYKSTHYDVDDTIRNNKKFNKITHFGYTNVEARNEAKKIFANDIKRVYWQNEYLGENKVTAKSLQESSNTNAPKTLLDYYINEVKTKFRKALAGRLAKEIGEDTKEKRKEIQAGLKPLNNDKWIDDFIKEHNITPNVQLENLIALYKEINSTKILGDSDENVTNPFAEFIDEIRLNSDISQIFRAAEISSDDEVSNKEFDEENQELDDVSSEDNVGDSEPDTYITTLNNKQGLYTTYMAHVGAPIRALLGSLPKMTFGDDANTKATFDTNNYIGMVDSMDVNTICTVLYNYINYENKELMMQSIKDASVMLPDMAGLSKLYDILEDNKALQEEVFRTFKKLLMGKVETVVRDGQTISRISNKEIDKLHVLKFNFINSIKSTALNANKDTNKEVAKLIHEDIKNYEEDLDTDGIKVRELSDKLWNALKDYYSNLNRYSIRNYILNNKNSKGEIDVRNNLLNLINILNNTIDGANDTLTAYKSRQSRIDSAKQTNRIINNDDKADRRDLIAINALYAESYISDKSQKQAESLAKMLLPYTLVETPLNSRTVKHTQQSNVINDSWLTGLKNILSSTLNTPTDTPDGKKYDKNAPIVKYGEFMFQIRKQGKTYTHDCKQFDLSNILIQHEDENGNIINKGLFIEDENGNFVPTENFDTLIQIQLYDGIENTDSQSNATYADMSKGDYIATAWSQFFNPTTDSTQSANYFMRIPSDAPKNFVITAPRYAVRGKVNLLSIDKENKKRIDKEITDFLNKVDANHITDTKDIIYYKYPLLVKKDSIYLNTESLVSHLRATETKPVNIKIATNRTKALSSVEGKTIKLAFRYANEDSDAADTNVYVMEGTYKNGTLHNAKFVGFLESGQTSIDGSLWSDIRDYIWNEKNMLREEQGGIKWNIDRNHPLFKQLVNAFKQETIDMAIAANSMFERRRIANGTYVIKMDDDGNPVLKKDNEVIKSNTEHNGLSPVYHFADPKDDGKGEIWTKENGKVKATGKVFTSDRLVVYNYFTKDKKENPIKNFGEELLNEYFNLFQARTIPNSRLLQFDKDGNIKFTKDQEDAINAKIEEFILAYINHGRERLKNVEDFIGKDNINTENIADFMLNTHMAYIGFGDLFEGNSKFYKNNQTFLKRAKEVQGSGVGYGITDITKGIAPGYNEDKSHYLNTTTFVHKVNGQTKPYNVKMYDSFRAITIFNTIRTDNPMLKTQMSVLTNPDIMGKNVLSEDRAKELLFGKDEKGGYTNTTINDAQSYITFDEWIRRITARGQLPKYKPLIDRILNEDTPLTVNDIQEFVQVQKNFYYDMYYNENTKTMSPRQIKNAEFVLVDRFVKGTELEKVLKLMKKIGVDQLNTSETSKAGQTYRFTLWDNDGHISQDILDDIDGNPNEYKSDIMINGPHAIEYYNYNYLYTQQETPQHLNDYNKAGIQIMKKILDNIDENSPKELQEAKKRFFELYSQNIKSSHDEFIDRMSIKDEAGNNLGINYSKFFDMLKEELSRLGLDSNMVDYCTQTLKNEGCTETRMPNYMSLVSYKFENLVQSIFNHNITRQLLKGFHAAQISGMGFRKLSESVNKSMTSNILQYRPQLYKNKNNDKDVITQREYDNLDDNKKKEYDKDKVASYIEIMLPASNFGFDRNSDRAKLIREAAMRDELLERERRQEPKPTKDELIRIGEEAVNNYFLKQLKDAELDEIIGYRIPTEGKQSIAVMKVVGFVDDALGSTIVVPDAWVSQTGSDFDIDSIYGIQYNTYFDKDGNIRKIEYNKDKRSLYQKYVFRNLTKSEINQLFEDSKLADVYVKDLKAKYTDTEGNFNNDGFVEELKETSKEVLEGLIEDIAEEKGLMSYDDFAEKDVDELNTKAARDNEILTFMRNILNNSASYEENLSRSNFDDIIEAINKCLEGTTNKIERKARTPFNFFDQAEYQEDVMSGAKIKGFSVTRDTFCSICNTIKPTLENDSEIRIEYPATYNEEELKSRFGAKNVSPSSTGGFIVTHRTFGWTNDNKNVDGKILTAYSSQTTAHILDAVKSGAVPNVNTLTFQVYKTLVDVGSNYDTAVSFIMQPGVRRIVNAYNRTNSLYAADKSKNYIRTAIRNILDELGIEYEYSHKTEDLLKLVNETYKPAIEYLFGKGYEFSANDALIGDIAISAERNLQRLQEQGIFADKPPVEEITTEQLKLLYDLQTILQYSKIDNLANNVRDAARVLNPDKFGAKQTLYATRQVFDGMVRSITNNKITDKDNKTIGTNYRLQVNGKHLLEAVYPRVSSAENSDDALDKILNDDNFVKDSKYQPLAAFLKYSTAESININKELFVTQSREFLDYITSPIYGLASAISDTRTVNEKTAKEFQNYVVNYFALRSRFLWNPISYNMGKGRSRGFDYKNINAESNGPEITRVFGYGYSPAVANTIINSDGKSIDVPFEVKDINNITQEEINKFNELSPAQKIMFIKLNFSNPGVFKYIDVQLSNEFGSRGRKVGTQTIRFNEDNTSVELAREDFTKAFDNKNPLVACAAADVIKYAFIVEGYKMGMRNVSKIIPNDVLINSDRLYGTSIKDDTNDRMTNLKGFLDTKEAENVIENFVRSHSGTLGINTYRVKKVNKAYELPYRSNFLVHINGSTKEGKKLAEDYGIATFNNKGESLRINKYVRLIYDNKPILYKIEYTYYDESNLEYFLIPLNPLEVNENSEFSANSDNNQYPRKEYYHIIIEDYQRRVADSRLSSEGGKVDFNFKLVNSADYKAKAVKNNRANANIPDINTNPIYKGIIDALSSWYDNKIENGKPIKYVWSNPLGKSIVNAGRNYAIKQKIRLNNGLTKDFIIYKVDAGRLIRKYTGNQIYREIEESDKVFEEAIDILREYAKMNDKNYVPLYFGDLYAIQELQTDESDDEDDVTGELYSSIEDVAVQSTRSIISRAYRANDEDAYKASQYFKEKDINPTVEGVKNNTDDVIVTTAKYLDNYTKELEHRLRNFAEDEETGKKLAVNDIKCINIVKKDPIKRREYLKTIMEPSTIVEQFGIIRDLDIQSQDITIQQSLTTIKEAVERMQNLDIISDAYQKFAEQDYDRSTDNPLIKKGLISVLDGYYKTNWLNSMFNDIQESSNPIVQIAMKNFQADVAAKERLARRRIDEFQNRIKELEKEAKANGQTFDLNHIIDENGKLRMAFNDKFLEDRDRLKNNVEEKKKKALDKQRSGQNANTEYIEYLKAKLDYDEWKAKYVQQEVKKEYYEERNRLIRGMLYKRDNIDDVNYITEYWDKLPEYYARYEQLRARLQELRNKQSGVEENRELDKQIEEVSNQISNMLYDFSGNVMSESYQQAYRLATFVNSIKALNRKYFKYEPSINFEDDLRRNLEIVEAYEESNQPAYLYANKPEYVKAKSWLVKNVYKDPDWSEGVREEIAGAYDVLRPESKYPIYQAVRNNKEYQDRYGMFDPSLIPLDVMEELKKQQEITYNISNNAAFSDRTLISNVEDENPPIYTQEFYNGITGGRKGKGQNPLWIETVTKINDILADYYEDGRVRIDKIPNTEAGIKILTELNRLYDVLREIRSPRKDEATIKFIEENVDRNYYYKDAYEADLMFVEGQPKGSEYRRQLVNLIKDVDSDNNVIPNRFLYGGLRPNKDKFIDKEKTKAKEIIAKYKERKLRNSYFTAKHEALKKGIKEYKKWYDTNHIYNPFKLAYEPLAIWYTVENKADSYSYSPKFNQTVRTPRDGKFTHQEAIREFENWEDFDSVKELEEHYFEEMDMTNKEYIKDGGHAANYVPGINPEYDNKTNANKYELEAAKYIEDTLMALANTQSAKKYFERGWLPHRAQDKPTNAKQWAKEAAKLFGWSYETYNPDEWYETIEYSKDKAPLMPMLELLKSKDSRKIKRIREREENESEENYEDYVAKTKAENEEIKKKNLEIHRSLMDKDYVNVISDFILQASRYNAIQENKYELFYAKQLLNRYGSYIPTYNKKGQLRLKKNISHSTEDNAEYLRTPDKNLIDQLDNQIRRMVYNQFKENNNPKLMKAMSILQSVTSAQYMMFNVRGGIANVTLGDSQIFGEAIAGEFFGIKEWAKSKAFYASAVHDYLLHSINNKDTANTLQGAIINFMDVVDYDEHTGVSRLSKNAYETLRKLRDFGYTPQTAGEHGMQNAAMFAMMDSHRLVQNPRKDEFNQGKWIVQNFNEFCRDAYEQALKDIMDDNQKKEYEKFKETISKDANAFKEYAWYQKDLTYDFARKLTKEQQKEFIKRREELKETLKKEFEDDSKHPTLLSQLTLGDDGKLAFVQSDDSTGWLGKEDVPKKNGEPSNALQLLANFRNRVVSVNKYIHGVYDKSGRAQLEKTFLGSLLMQYHKHLPVGIRKRWGQKGWYSEERGQINKGIARSFFDFVSIPFNEHRDKFTDEEILSLTSLQELMKEVLSFAVNVKLNYQMLPDYEKANMRRIMADLTGVLASVFVILALNAGADDDDKDGLLYNLALYEADRLATESAQYFPLFSISEAKKLWQSPIAAGSGVTDAISTVGMLCQMVIEGEDFDGEYHSGKFAGESKLKVYIERRIPIWRGIKSSFIDIVDNNRYYKVGENFLTYFNIAPSKK